MLSINGIMYVHSELSIVYICMGIQYKGYNGGIQYSLVNIVWDTASTGSYGGTVFPEGKCYSLVNNVCGVRYSLGYRIHSDTGDTNCVPGRSLKYCAYMGVTTP